MTTETQTPKCTQCGADLREGAFFCVMCGTQIQERINEEHDTSVLNNEIVSTVNGKKKGKGLLVVTCVIMLVSIIAVYVYYMNNKYLYAKGIYAVDLGLSVKWSSCNVGALSPEECGNYYAWGESESKKDYSSISYKFYNAKKKTYTNIGKNISATSYDVAHIKLGENWRMPTKSEFDELINECSWKWVKVRGVYGQKVTGPNGRSIFFPSVGYIHKVDCLNKDLRGHYWSATLNTNQDDRAWNLYFGDGHRGWENGKCKIYNGLSVRPVKEYSISSKSSSSSSWY